MYSFELVQEIDCCLSTIGPKSSRDEQVRILKQTIQSRANQRSSSVITDRRNQIQEELTLEETIDEGKDVIRSEVLSIELSLDETFMVVCLSDGKLLLFLLPNIMESNQFELLFNHLQYETKTPTGRGRSSTLEAIGKGLKNLFMKA